MRVDHLKAVIKYAIEQTKAGGGVINPLNWDENQNAVGQLTVDMDVEQAEDEILHALEGLLTEVEQADSRHCTGELVLYQSSVRDDFKVIIDTIDQLPQHNDLDMISDLLKSLI